jgi:predicted transcriptional regulator
MNNRWYEIKDVEGFVKSTRILVFNNFGKNKTDDPIDMLIDNVKPEEQDEFDQVLSQSESLAIAFNILRKQTNDITKKTRYLISDNKFMELVQLLSDRMVSNILNSLVNKGILDTAFDNESQDFVFWIKDNDKNKEIPETD